MAEYIKFRWASARVGASMALLALIAGVADKAHAAPARASAASNSVGSALKLQGLSATISGDFIKIEKKLNQVNDALAKIEHKLTKNFYDKSAENKSFLKIKSANTAFLKISAANAAFLKTSDANAKFLKLGSTAQNANKLGGLTPDAYVKGHASIVSGATTVAPADVNPTTLLQSAGGIIVVAVSGGGSSLTITNHSSGILPAVQTVEETTIPVGAPPLPTDVTTSSVDLPANGSKTISLGASPQEIYQVHVQIFPNAAAGVKEVQTLTLSIEPDPAISGNRVVTGQMVVGLL